MIYIHRSPTGLFPVYLRLDPGNGVPLGTQIARQLRLALASGRIAPGEQLPSARDAALELGVNFHTVRKAYATLESEGLLDTRRGLGTFAASRRPKLRVAEQRDLVTEHLRQLLEDLAGAQFDPARVERLLLDEWRRLAPPTAPQGDNP